jgi:hypothetical protein
MKYKQMHSITIYYYINTLRHVSAPSSAILRELEVILLIMLIHKGGGEQFHQDHFELPEDGTLRYRNM